MVEHLSDNFPRFTLYLEEFEVSSAGDFLVVTASVFQRHGVPGGRSQSACGDSSSMEHI